MANLEFKKLFSEPYPVASNESLGFHKMEREGEPLDGFTFADDALTSYISSQSVCRIPQSYSYKSNITEYEGLRLPVSNIEALAGLSNYSVVTNILIELPFNTDKREYSFTGSTFRSGYTDILDDIASYHIDSEYVYIVYIALTVTFLPTIARNWWSAMSQLVSGPVNMNNRYYDELPPSSIITSSNKTFGFGIVNFTENIPVRGIDNSVNTIAAGVFKNSNNLQKAILPKSLRQIGLEAFMNSYIESITIPENVEEIADYAFSGTRNLNTIFFNAKNMNDTLDAAGRGNSIFYASGNPSTGTYTCITGPNVEYMPGGLFGPSNYNRTPDFYLNKIDMSNSFKLKELGNHAFQNCFYLNDIKLPPNLEIMNEGSFSLSGRNDYNANKFSITLPASLKTLGTWCFNESAIQSYDFEPGKEPALEDIGLSTFESAANLEVAIIPENVKSIGERAFFSCKKLKRIEYNAVSCNDLINRNDVFYQAGYEGAGIVLNVGPKVERIPAYLFNPYNGSYSPRITGITFIEKSKCTSIGDYAFYGCSYLKDITIPSSLTEIGYGAFYSCTGLRRLDIDSIANWCKIKFSDKSANPLYYAHDLYVNNMLVLDITIPSSITKIEDYAFRNCSLKTLILSEGVKSIGSYAFSECSALTSITIPSSVTNIATDSFNLCGNLANIIVEQGNIEYDSRDNCNAIIKTSSNTLILAGPKTTIPNGVIQINGNAFVSISDIERLSIPDSVTTINGNSSNCVNLTRIDIKNINQWLNINHSGTLFFGHGGTLYINDEPLTHLNIPSDYNSIVSPYTFSYNYGITSASLGGSIDIGGYAFYRCKNLTNITIPSSVTNIGSYAFFQCSGLTNITILEGLINIRDSAFYDCSSLESIAIPNSVTNIESNAFFQCSGLTKVNISSLQNWCEISFGNYAANPLYYAKNLYLNNELVTNITIPSSVTSIGNYAFYNCSNLTNITIPSSVTSIGSSAFYNCSNLTNITIPSSVTSIGSSAFRSCTGLTSIRMTFSTSGVSVIPASMFYLCSSVTVYNFSGSTVVPILGSTSALGHASGCEIRVPSSLLDSWRSATNWSSLTDVTWVGV